MSSTKPECDPAREQQQEAPATLDEAHDLLRSLRPAWGASDEEWTAFYRYSAKVFMETAKIDQRRWDEAMLWAGTCMRCAGFAVLRAQEVEEELDSDLAGDDS